MYSFNSFLSNTALAAIHPIVDENRLNVFNNQNDFMLKQYHINLRPESFT